MTYYAPPPEDPLDQGDLIDDCPVATVMDTRPVRPEAAIVQVDLNRVIVLSQTCDLVQGKTPDGIVATVFDAQKLVQTNILKTVDIKGPLRAGRIWGLYFLPADAILGLGEMIVDLRRLHTIRLGLLTALCRDGKRRARLVVPYREHLAKHFADSYSRIGLPRPYETL